jgi:hypothetical protein
MGENKALKANPIPEKYLLQSFIELTDMGLHLIFHKLVMV